MKINWKVRLKNPVFWAQVVLAVITPIFAYFGINSADMTSWDLLGKTLLSAVSNPYVCVTVVISVFNAINDPTTAGMSDSKEALSYSAPKKRGDSDVDTK